MATSEPILPGEAISQSVDGEDSADLDLCSVAEPSDLDRRIYWARRAGKSIKQLAKSQQLTEDAVRQAIFRVELDNERYSSLATGVETRRLFLQGMERISTTLADALIATKLIGRKVMLIDKETGDVQTVEESVERPDHDTRLKAVDSMRQLVSVVQPKDPAVVVNTTTNTQNNVLNAPQIGANGHGALTSPEAVIRSIVQERQKALPQPAAPAFVIPTTKPTATLEGVLAMAQDPEQPEGEYEEDLDDPEDDGSSEDEGDLEDDDLAEDDEPDAK